MSRSISLYSCAEADEASFREFVTEVGGTIWHDELPGMNATFSEGDCHVWIYGLTFPADKHIEDASAEVFQRLGCPIKTHVNLVLSHTQASAALALRLALGILNRWPGVADFPICTVLAGGVAEDLLPQASAWGFFGSEVQVLAARIPELGSVIEEIGGLVVSRDDTELYASSVKVLSETSDVDANRDTIVGMIATNGAYVWVLTSVFDPVTTDPWDLLAPSVRRHVGETPVRMVRVVIDAAGDAREGAKAAALSLAKHIASLGGCVLFGTFYVALDPEQIRFVLRSGQWALL